MAASGRTDFSTDVESTERQELRNRWVLWKELDLVGCRYTSAEEKKEADVDQYDFEVELTDGSIKRFDFKNWENVPQNKIVVETDHDVRENVDGWIDYGPDHWDYLVGVWHTEDVYSYIILHGRKLRAWWYNIQKTGSPRYRKRLNDTTYVNGRVRNRSAFCFVPIEDIPEEVIMVHRRQTQVDEWGVGL